jgi:hypothetical protein
MPALPAARDPLAVTTPTRRPGRAALQTLLVDVAAPLVHYYGLHAAGVDDLTALAVGAALQAVVTATRERRVEPVAVAVLVAMAPAVRKPPCPVRRMKEPGSTIPGAQKSLITLLSVVLGRMILSVFVLST